MIRQSTRLNVMRERSSLGGLLNTTFFPFQVFNAFGNAFIFWKKARHSAKFHACATFCNSTHLRYYFLGKSSLLRTLECLGRFPIVSPQYYQYLNCSFSVFFNRTITFFKKFPTKDPKQTTQKKKQKPAAVWKNTHLLLVCDWLEVGCDSRHIHRSLF